MKDNVEIKGLGDVVEKVIHSVVPSAIIKAATKKKCNCKNRKEMLNKLMPFNKDK